MKQPKIYRIKQVITIQTFKLMKTRNLLVMGLLGLGLMTACSNEDEMNENEPAKGNAQMQIQLTIANNANSSSTRAETTTPTELGTENEYAISTITVVLADANNIAKHVYKNISVKTAADGATGSNIKTVASQPFAVEAGNYKVYVLANYEDGYMTPVIANSTDMATTVFTVSSYTGTSCPLATAKKFLMTNTTEPVTSTISSTSTTQEIESNGSETQNGKTVNLVNVTLERSVAKVTFKNQSTTAFDVKDANNVKIATATIGGVDLINLNSQMYLIRKDVTYTSLNVTGIGYTDLYYAQDPNYTTGWDDAWATSGNPFYNATGNPASFNKDNTVFYCLENTMGATQQQNGLTTGVVYKVKYEPEANKYTKLSTTTTAGDLYSQKFKAVVEANNAAEESGSKDETILETMFDKIESSPSFFVYSELIFASEYAAKMYKAISLNSTSDAAAIITAYQGYKASTQEDITFYEDGYCYYTAWIRHNTATGAGVMEAGKYGVIRNHWYDIQVANIKKLGYDQPTYEDPTNPDDKSDVFLQIKVTINPWRYISQQVDLE